MHACGACLRVYRACVWTHRTRHEHMNKKPAKANRKNADADPLKVLARAIKTAASNVYNNDLSLRLSEDVKNLSATLPESVRWSVTPKAILAFIFEKFSDPSLNLARAVRDAVEDDSDGFIGDEIAEILATEAMALFGRATVGLSTRAILRHGEVSSGGSFDIAQGWSIFFHKASPDEDARPNSFRGCTLHFELDAFCLAEAEPIVSKTAEEFRMLLALLWLNGCCIFQAGFTGLSRQTPSTQHEFRSKDKDPKPFRFSFFDPVAHSLAGQCIVLLPRGLGSLEDVRLCYRYLKSIAPALQQQIARAVHFLTQSLAATSIEDKLVSMCTAFECLLGWALDAAESASTKNGSSDASAIDNKFVKSRMIDRTVFLLGGNRAERTENSTTVRELYAERSELVHGSRTKLDDSKARRIINAAEPLFRRCLNEIIFRFHEITATPGEEPPKPKAPLPL